MVVRIVTCEAGSRAAANAWVREHADEFREPEGVERVTFIHSRQPPRVGAVMVFESADALARYKTTGPFQRLVDSLRQAWAGDDRPVREETYRVMEV